MGGNWLHHYRGIGVDQEIENIEIRFSGSANFKEVYAEAAKLNAALKRIQMDLAKVHPGDIGAARADFRQNVRALNDYYVQAVRAKSATAQLTEGLLKQEVSLRQAIRQRKLFNEVLKEQYAIQRMSAVQYTKNAAGVISADVVVPRGVPERIAKMAESWKYNIRELVAARTELSMVEKGTDAATAASERYATALQMVKTRQALVDQSLSSASLKMINWGKNTQWAGRQLMVGFTVPMVAFAAATGKMAYDVDKEFTRVTKVYDFTSNGAAQAAERQNLFNNSMNLGRFAARQYGAALKDTLDVEAQLAATGLRGQELIKATAEVQRASTLGEMDYNDTIKATIALQSVLHHNSSQLADDFNYMNAMENATNLSMQDFVTAIPRALGPLHALGLNLRDMGVLMETMKSRGIDAAQGANALKSGLNRVLNPAQSVSKALHGYGIDIDKIVESSGGNFMKILVELSDQMKNLDALSRQRIIGKLFGTYQYSRINAILQGLQDVHDTTTQVGRAFQVSQMDAVQFSAVAQRELERFQQSASGRLKIAIETIKTQFVGLGKSFLPLAADILKFIGWIIKEFNKVPDVFKKVGFGIAIIAALAGGILMLAGLMGNLLGQGLKVVQMIASIGRQEEILTTQQAAAKALGEQTSRVWQSQADSAKTLSLQVANLTDQLELLALAQNSAALKASGLTAQQALSLGAVGRPGGAGTPLAVNLKETVGKNGRTYYNRPAELGGGFASKSEIATYLAAKSASADIAENTAETGRNWGKIANRVMVLGTGASMMASMATGSHKVLNTLTQALMISSMIGPSIIRQLGAGKIGIAGQAVSTAFKDARAGGAGLAESIGKALPKMGTLLSVAARFAGPTGILVGGLYTWYKINKAMAESRKRQEDIDTSAKTWADVLGFVYQEQTKITDSQNKGKSSLLTLADAYEKANKSSAEYLQKLKETGTEQEVINAAILEGVKVRQHGASAQQANETVQVALRVAGYNDTEVKNLMKTIAKQIDFHSAQSILNQQAKGFATTFQRLIANNFEQSHWEGFRRALGGGNNLNSAARQAAKDLATDFINSFESTTSDKGRFQLLNNFRTMIDKQGDEVFNSLHDGMTQKFRQAGIDSYKELVQAMTDQKNMNYLDFQSKWGDQVNFLLQGMNSDDLKRVTHLQDAITTIIQTIVAADPALKDYKDVTSLHDLHMDTGKVTMTAAEAQKEYNQQLAQGAAHGEKATKAQQLHVLNLYREAAGLKDATSLEQGFSDAVDANGNALDANGNKLAGNKGKVEDLTQAYSQLADTMKTAYSGAIDSAVSAADQIAGYWQQSQEDAMQSQADAQNKAFDRQERRLHQHFNKLRRETRNRYHDQIHDLNQQINAEQAAENRRESLFEAEQTRLQRMAASENNSIDFNVALNTGNLDEAAKIINNSQATEDQNAIEDAQKKAQTASERRIKSLEKEKKAIIEARDAALKALDKEEAAQKKALERRRRLYEEEEQAKERSLQRELDLRRRYLDLELAAIRSNTPRNKAEYDHQIAQIEAAYQRYGVRLQDYGDTWGKFVGDALESNVKTAANGLRDQINWQFIAHNVANKFAEGAFGLNIRQFAHWLNTGKLPKDGIHPSKGPSGGVTAYAPGRRTMDMPGRHGGGPLGGGAEYDNLAGRSPSSGLYRDEIMVRAQKGEYVINRHAHKRLGTPFLDSLNAVGRHAGGPLGRNDSVGISGLAMSLLTSMLSAAVGGQIVNSGAAALGLKATGQPSMPDKPIKVPSGNVSGTVVEWLMKALRLTGKPTSWLPGLKLIVSNESGGNPRAYNPTPVPNGIYGNEHAEGLFQTLPSTFRAYVDPRVPPSIWNPVSNATAGINYIASRYHSVWNVPGVKSIASGGPYLPYDTGGKLMPGMTSVFNGTGKPEMVFTAEQWETLGRIVSSAATNHIRPRHNVPAQPVGGDTFNVTVDFRGATIEKDVDIEKAVYKALEKAESKRGRSRRIGSNS